ncbi:hypothetical protein VNO80_33878 [Phaseolus coccineus]|uniref:Uncharacterized protein n=1 Tax=Phaseolus coccineus TaxID=3886 RepID=A0AAN9Q8G9_PHACN
MISRVRFQEADSDGSLRGWIGGSRGLVGRRPILCILNDLGDNVVQIRAIPVLRPDRRGMDSSKRNTHPSLANRNSTTDGPEDLGSDA